MPEATMTSKGQITVPKEVRESLRLKAGDRVWFVRTEDGYRVIARNLTLADVAGMLKYDGPPLSIDEMDPARSSIVYESETREDRMR